MSTAMVMRLLPEQAVPKGLALLNAGNAVATTISAPLGSYIGGMIGWRGAFFFVVPLALLALVWQWISMPPLPPRHRAGRGNVFRLLRHPQVALGMSAVFLLFMGQFALFTYLRPFLETVSGYSVPALSSVFLLMGVAGVVGTLCASRLLGSHLYLVVTGIPLILAALAALLIALGSAQLPVAVLLGAWGFFGTAAPVGWGTWLSRVLPEDAEAGGGLLVAIIQFAITLGAAVGGLLFDWAGWWSAFAFAGVALLGASATAAAAWLNWEKSPSERSASTEAPGVMNDSQAARAVSRMPSAFITPTKVDSFGSPSAVSALYSASRVTPASRASCDMPFARATTPSAWVMRAGSPSSKAASI